MMAPRLRPPRRRPLPSTALTLPPPMQRRTASAATKPQAPRDGPIAGNTLEAPVVTLGWAVDYALSVCERWQACSLPRLPGNPRHTCASTPASPGSPGAAPTAHKQAPDPCEPSAGAGPPPQKLPVAGGLAAARPRRGGYTDRPRARSRSAAFLPTLTPSDHLQHGPGPRKLQEAALPFVLHRAVAPPPPPLPPSVAPAGRCPRLPAMCSSKPHPGRAHCPVHSLGGRGGRGSEPRALWPAAVALCEPLRRDPVCRAPHHR